LLQLDFNIYFLLDMLKGEKLTTPYFNMNSPGGSSLSTLAKLNSSSIGKDGLNSSTNQQQKVTRRRVHEICGK
jgi:hypothetical protein